MFVGSMPHDRGGEAKDAFVVSAVEDEAAMSTKLRAWPASSNLLAANAAAATAAPRQRRVPQRVLLIAQIVLFGIIVLQFVMYYKTYYLAAAAAGLVDAGMLNRQASSHIPDYYQTTPEFLPGRWNIYPCNVQTINTLCAGPTPTGQPGFLAQSNPAPFSGTVSGSAQPLEGKKY